MLWDEIMILKERRDKEIAGGSNWQQYLGS
jgi:hypothetical protein